MKTYEYPKSRELFAKATKIIPAGIYGHLGPTEGCFVPVSAYPFYVERAKGAYMWDVDGNRFIDYMCAYGPNVLGYCDPDVDAAYTAQLNKANCTTIPSELMIELAELLVDTVDSADWAFFAKNGGDVTNLAMLSSRAATGRKKIIKFNGGYHGVAPWMTGMGYAGVTPEDMAHVISIPFNDIPALEKALSENEGEVACLIGTPYSHPIFEASTLPEKNYWNRAVELCHKAGALVIIDDVRCGFRLDVRGSDHYFGFKADLICFCKALANGYNISALCGRSEYKSAVSSVFYTGSYWLSAAPMAAAIACIKKLREMDSGEFLRKRGQKVCDTLREACKSEGFDLLISGVPSMWFMSMAGDENHMIHQAFIAECVRRGAFFVNHHNLFMNASVSDDDIKLTGEIAAEACRAVKKSIKI